MKTLEYGAPINLLRRRLFLGAPAGLLMASPLALLGCGGGGGADDPATPAGDDSLHDAGRAFVGTRSFTDLAVGVEVPAGVTVPAGGLAAHTLVGGFGVVAAGVATLPMLFDGPQLATVYTADRLPLLFGFVGAGLPAISARSTATALIAYSLGTEFTASATNAAWIASIQASDAAGVLANVISTALAADVYALARGNAAIDQGVAAAVRALLPANFVAGMATRAHPLGLAINPPNAASGVQPIVAETVNTLYVQNEKMRRAWYVIRRESYVGADGTMVVDAARPSVAEGDIPMLPGFDSAGGIIGSVTEALYGGDDTGLAFSKTPETLLALLPADAKNTTYSVTVLMAGLLGYDLPAFSKLSSAEKAKIDITLFSTEHLGLQTLMIDWLVPMFMSWLGSKVEEQGAGLGAREHKQKLQIALLGQLLTVMSSTLPGIVTKLQDVTTKPPYGVGDALADIVSTHLVDSVEVPTPGGPVIVPTLSTFSMQVIELLVKYIAYEKMSAVNGEAVLNFLEGDANTAGTRYSWNVNGKTIEFDKENLKFAGIGVAMKALSTADAILGNLAKVRAVADLATSKTLEVWEVKTIKPKLKLNPTPFEVDDLGGTFPLTIEIVDNDDDAYGNEKGSFRFDWVCTAKYGDLRKRNGTPGQQEQNVFSTGSANTTADYIANTTTHDDANPDKVTVTVYFEPIGSSKPAELIGSVETTVKFKKELHVGISPSTMTVFPSDTEMQFSSFFQEKLPTGATVAWEWSLVGAGSLVTIPADSNPADSKVTYRSGSSEGPATITVKATVDVPATAGKPSHFVITDPVSVSFNVKKGLKTISFEASGGVFGCTDPLACGVSEYTAFLVPRFPNAVLYQAVLSGYAYPGCNRTVTWNSVKGDGGDCNFPVTYYPHSSAGATNTWAVWIGFGGPMSGKCVVTVTLTQ
ncbi:MAG: hypothetical protein K8R60_03030 [Burkholderiales bacterium]|nr:hypothetical protein [Burkholderiales bacterium]